MPWPWNQGDSKIYPETQRSKLLAHCSSLNKNGLYRLIVSGVIGYVLVEGTVSVGCSLRGFKSLSGLLSLQAANGSR